MLYIFNIVRAICEVPGQLCRICGTIFEQIRCQFCVDCCNALSIGCHEFLLRPLSSFVVITCMLSLLELACCIGAYTSPALEGCLAKTPSYPGVPIKRWLFVQMCFAGINLIFAPYFQSRVWQHIWEQMVLLGQPHAGITMLMVQQSFKQVFLHDLGVAFYFVALLASFWWSWKGTEWSSFGSQCNPMGFVDNAAGLGMSFFWVAIIYSLFWYWCSCCAASMDILSCGATAYSNQWPVQQQQQQALQAQQAMQAYAPWPNNVPVQQGVVVPGYAGIPSQAHLTVHPQPAQHDGTRSSRHGRRGHSKSGKGSYSTRGSFSSQAGPVVQGTVISRAF
mmetsp:Transcript_44978/g.89055  ORF Transcript_44978/g.89055 Transcript_44978/m.89055 type:complete len:335 (-) Transcript_44978:38-1042(-)